ncbi:MAG TPA: BTAD domain-containing putative transcriptional regulator, partial [Acidimicrobiia bacterium]|nr:BTAD domain-containing putative transcriptional regulator [Acidimicrobiia bacterium]
AGLEGRRLEELRLSALEDRIGADLAAGRHAEVVPELEALTAEHPLRERLWAQYMVALYRSDRQAEALRAYQGLSTRLGEELGIEPSPDLRRLEESILLQDPDLDVPEGLQRPSSLRGYQLLERIGEGAFGFVWRASQVSVDREVAVKVVRPEHSNRPGAVLGFQAQAQLLATLEHPHVVPIFDFWRDPDGAYLVMPLMAGGSLEKADTATWNTSRAVGVIEQITSGLAHAHRLGFVHADLHPGNVLFDAEGNAYLADFGLAANLSEGGSTPPAAFASPEQARGERAGPAADVYGLGRLAYRVLAGVNPGTGPLPGIRAARPDVRGAVDTVLRRATDLDPACRYRDATGFLDDFRRAVGQEPAPAGELRNPYKGLRAFGEADAPDFYGQDDLVEELVGAMAAHRLVAAVGPSGCGKSSLVRAGLIPALRVGRIPGSEGWLFADLYPGADPFAALAEALRSVAVQAVPDPSDPGWDPDGVAATVRGVLPPDGELVLVIDQFEELFTLCPDEHERTRFMQVLLALARDPAARTRVVLTLRADYYGLPLEYRPFGEALREAVVAITPPGPDQLTQAIVGPAAALGVEVGPELAADIVGDVAAEPGGLPLMEHALTRLFEERADGLLSTAVYRRMGGLTEALADWPESLFDALAATGRSACRQVFLRLVSVDESGRGNRRRVALAELYGLGIEKATVDGVLASFFGARLLTFDRDPLSREPTVEMAHEALLGHWRRLRAWVDERRELLVMRRRFGVALADWEQAGRDDEYLLRGGRLRQFEAWSRETDLAVTEAEAEYLRASRAREETLRAARRHRWTLIGVVLGLLTVAAAVFGVVAMVQRNRAAAQQQIAEQQTVLAVEEAGRAETQAALAATEQQRAEEQASIAEQQAGIAENERERAEEQERIARARGLAAAAAAQIDLDPELAVMLAVEAIETTREADGTVLREAEEALHAALSADRLVSNVPAEMWARSLAYTPDGTGFYLGGMTRGQIVAAPSGRVEGEFLVGSIS